MKKLLALLAVVLMSYGVAKADVCFDDFDNQLDDTDNQTAIGAMFNYYNSATDKFYDAGYWYAYSDQNDGGSSTATPDYETDKEFESGLEQNGYSGQCLHIDITLGDAIDEWGTAFYGVGANITMEGVYTDFSKMTGVEFMAKGSGTYNFKLLTKVTDETGTWGDMVAPFKVSADWQKITITPADIVPEPWSPDEEAGITWDDAKTAVTKMHWQTNGDKMKAGDTGSLWLDNIIIKGMDPEDFEFTDPKTGDQRTIQEVYPLPDGAVKEVAKAKEIELGDAVPNPFNPTTTISFSVPTAQKVSLKVYDAAGNLVKTLYNGVASGVKRVSWNATDVNGAKVASGVYFYKLTVGNKTLTKSMVFMK